MPSVVTMGDGKNCFVANSINRYSVSHRSGVVPNVVAPSTFAFRTPLRQGRIEPAASAGGEIHSSAARVCAWRSHSRRQVQMTHMEEFSSTFGGASFCTCSRERSSLKGWRRPHPGRAGLRRSIDTCRDVHGQHANQTASENLQIRMATRRAVEEIPDNEQQ
jgi:hypothetical protein